MEKDQLYRNISLPESVAGLLQRLAADAGPGSIDATAGPLIYLLARAVRPTRIVEIGARDGRTTLWLAAVARHHGSAFEVRAESSRREAVAQLLQEAALDLSLQLHDRRDAPLPEPVDFVLLHLDAVPWDALPAWLERGLSDRALLVACGRDAGQVERLVTQLSAAPRWRATVVQGEQDGTSFGLASRPERPAQYDESPREAFVSLFLHAVQPGNLLLGSNVVFEGAIKPRATKVHFSGMGGQLAAGDLLLAHPPNLQHYTPQPGAVALVLGEPAGPIRSSHLTLQLGEEKLTLVVA